MKIIKPSFEILTPVNRDEFLKDIEVIGRTCYKSEDKITDTSAINFIKMLVKRGHEAMIEHKSISVKVICDRGVSHEIVRHRVASYAQESTRYCDYSKDKFNSEIAVIRPYFFEEGSAKYTTWEWAVKAAEEAYFTLLDNGASAQEARSVLPNSLKTEIVITMNLREWRNFFRLRTASAAHPQMLEITIPMLYKFKELLPEIFADIEVI